MNDSLAEARERGETERRSQTLRANPLNTNCEDSRRRRGVQVLHCLGFRMPAAQLRLSWAGRGPAFENLHCRKPRVGRAPSPPRAMGILAPLASVLDRLERRSKTILKDAA